MQAAVTTLTEAERAEYQRDGFLAREGILDEGEVEEAREALGILIDTMHASALKGADGIVLEKAGPQASSNYAGLEIQKKGTDFVLRFEAGTDPFTMTPDQAQKSVRVLYGYRNQSPVFRRLIEHPRILAVVHSIVGPGAVLFQDMALIKPPLIGSEKPWHQDDAYFSWAPVEKIVGVWIALDEARADNGCMHVIPGGHRRGGLRHFHSSLDCEIMPGRVESREAVPVELQPGGALFFSGLMPHMTPPNRSPHRRRALQFHYRGADTRKLEPVEYDRVFVEADGTPASCRAART